MGQTLCESEVSRAQEERRKKGSLLKLNRSSCAAFARGHGATHADVSTDVRPSVPAAPPCDRTWRYVRGDADLSLLVGGDAPAFRPGLADDNAERGLDNTLRERLGCG